MSNYLKFYRRLVAAQWVPKIMKRVMGRLAMRRHQALFKDRHTRLTEYQICLMGESFRFNVDIQDYTDSYFIYDRCYEERNLRLLKNDLKRGDIFIDGGANIGWFTIFASQLVGDEGKVFAVEPCPRNAYVLKTNVEANNATNVSIHCVALSDTNGRLELKGRLLNSGAGTIENDFGTDPTVDVFLWSKEVDALTLSRLFEQNGIGICNWLKLDIQGAEPSVIKGSFSLFEQGRIKNMIAECGSVPELEEIHSRLIPFGYRVGKICEGNIQWMQPKENFQPKRDYLFTIMKK